MTDWHERYFNLAREVSTWSKDPSSKIGCVYVGNKGQILSTGYNGFPRGIKDTAERLADRELKYALVSHAEMNGIYNACLNGTSLANSHLYVHGLPICSECAKGIIQVGVSIVFIKEEDLNKSEKWKKSFELTQYLFNEANVAVNII